MLSIGKSPYHGWDGIWCLPAYPQSIVGFWGCPVFRETLKYGTLYGVPMDPQFYGHLSQASTNFLQVYPQGVHLLSPCRYRIAQAPASVFLGSAAQHLLPDWPLDPPTAAKVTGTECI